MSTPAKALLSSLLFTAASLCCNCSWAAGGVEVAMVTDLQGKAELIGNPREPALSILSTIRVDSRVQLAASGRLAVIYLQSGQEFEVQGPATIHFGGQQPESTSGNPLSKRGVALPQSRKTITIQPVTVAQAAIVLRGVTLDRKLKLSGPVSGTLLEAHPLFQWQEMPTGSNYQFELLDSSRASIFRATVNEPRLRLPDSIQLSEDSNYTWMVSAQLPDSLPYSNARDFSIAAPELRDEVQHLRPVPDAPLSERVVFAAWLEQVGLHDEARKYWTLLSAERPDDLRLKAHASGD